MAKNDNLTDFLTDVANAIREKKGTTDLINPQDFSAEIASIETGGGGGVAASANDVNFRDYDGTILHSYSKDEFLALSELPALPTQQGLICQGWNYTLEDAQSYVVDYGKIEVGATYITDDGKTRLYITVPKYRQDIPLYFNQTVANGVTIDWGDGSAPETNSGLTYIRITHHYNTPGNYTIALSVADGCNLDLGNSESSSCVLGRVSEGITVYSSALKKVEVGRGVGKVSNYAFRYCSALTYVTIPQSVTSIGNSAFGGCYSLLSVIIPEGVTSLGDSVFSTCYSLTSVTIPEGVTSISSNTFVNCYSLASIVIPQSVTSINYDAFRYVKTLASIVIPEGVTSIGNSAFGSCSSLASVIIPEGVISIGNSVFSECVALASIVIPEGVTSLGDSVFSTCYSLTSVTIPEGVTSIGNGLFNYCYSLPSVIIPKSVTSIGSNSFYRCTSMAVIDFRASVAVPTLSSTNAFSSISSDCKIVIPDSLYDEWIAATNWSSFVSKIIKASEYSG